MYGERVWWMRGHTVDTGGGRSYNGVCGACLVDEGAHCGHGRR